MTLTACGSTSSNEETTPAEVNVEVMTETPENIVTETPDLSEEEVDALFEEMMNQVDEEISSEIEAETEVVTEEMPYVEGNGELNPGITE